jgi:hypothetical protein
MTHRQHVASIAVALIAGAAIALPATPAAAFAGNNVSALDRGFVPDTGQIAAAADPDAGASPRRYCDAG